VQRKNDRKRAGPGAGKSARIAALYLSLHGGIKVNAFVSFGHTLTPRIIAHTVVVAEE